MMMSRVRGMPWGYTVHGGHDETDLSGVCCASEMGVYLSLASTGIAGYLFDFGLVE